MLHTQPTHPLHGQIFVHLGVAQASAAECYGHALDRQAG